MENHKWTKHAQQLLWLLLLIPYIASAHVPVHEKGSLKGLSPHVMGDSAQIDLYLELADSYKYIAPEQSLRYADSAFSLAKQHESNLHLAMAVALKGIYYKLKGEFRESLDAYFQSIQYNQLAHDTINWANNLSNIGNLYFSMEDYEKSEKYFIEALRLQQQAGHEISFVPIYINLSAIHIDGTKNYDQAVVYLERALSISKKHKKIQLIVPSLINLSEVYYYQGEYDQSIVQLEQAHGLAQQVLDKHSMIYIQYCYGRIYKDQREYVKALEVLHQGQEAAKALQFKPMLEKIAEEIAKVYALQKDFENAYNAQEQYTQISDSLHEEHQQMMTAHKAHDDASKISEIKEDWTLKAHFNKQKKFYLFFGGATLLLLFVASMIIHFSKKRKEN